MIIMHNVMLKGRLALRPFKIIIEKATFSWRRSVFRTALLKGKLMIVLNLEDQMVYILSDKKTN